MILLICFLLQRVLCLNSSAFVVIASPRKNAVIAANDVDPSTNRVKVQVTLHYYDLHLEEDDLALWIRVDRGQTIAMGPPLPGSQFEISLRLGTHYIEACLSTNTKTPNNCQFSSTLFDLVPRRDRMHVLLRADNKVMIPQKKSKRPRGDLVEKRQCLRTIRILLIGSLSLGGQAMLALEQARRLPKIKLPNGSPAFQLVYATSAPADSPEQPLRPLLEALGIPVRRYAAGIPWELLDQLGISPEDGASNAAGAVAQALSTHPFGLPLPDLLQQVAGDLVALLSEIDVVSFTNHESYVDADEFIIQCARLAGVKHILNEPANLWWGQPPAGTGKDRNDHVSGLVLPSKFAADFWAQHNEIHPDVKLFIINPGIDENSFTKDTENETETSIRLGWVGRLAPQKSPGLFVRAAAALHALYRDHSILNLPQFVIIGDGPLRQACEQLALDLGLRLDEDIHFKGWLPPELVPSAVRNMTDLVVHTNILEETFCMCNVEALAQGKPIVSFGIGGVSEYLNPRDDHGIIVDTPSVPALVAALVPMIENATLLSSMRRAAKRRVLVESDFSFNRMATQYANMYTELVCEDVMSPQQLLGEAATVACQGIADWRDPGLLLEQGELWQGACAMATHLMAANHISAAAFHAIALALAISSRSFFDSVTPSPGTRASRALELTIGLTGLGLLLVDNDDKDRSTGLRRLAAVARATLGIEPDTAADDYYFVAAARRGFEDVEYLDAWLNTSAAKLDVPGSHGVSIGVNDGSTRSIELSISGSSAGRQPPYYTSAHKLRHDAHQFEYLARNGIQLERVGRQILQKALHFAELDQEDTDSSLLRTAASAFFYTANAVEASVGSDPASMASLRILASANPTSPELKVALAAHGKFIHMNLPRAISQPLASTWNEQQVAVDFYSQDTPGVAVIDNALSSECLALLRDQMIESTVYFDVKRGHLGAYLEDGLASGLLLQTADAFQKRLGQQIIGNMRLVQAWAYKYLYNGTMGIRPHADEGAVTVNCWLTPDSENLDPDSGGLRIYLRETPSNFSFFAANEDFRSVMAAIGEDAPYLDIPHRENRCVVFRSRLTHLTQSLRFKSAFRSSRINLTLMFGSTNWRSPASS